MQTKQVVIVGGGYAGCGLAKQLDRIVDVTLIEPKDYFFHAPAAIRAVVRPELVNQLLIPYNNFLKRGQVIKGKAAALRPDGVELEDGAVLPADLTIVATGSAHASPFKVSDLGIDAFRQANAELACQINTCQVIVIVGAGPVGIELAGEIANTFPGKTIHLITPHARLMPNYKPAFGQKLTVMLERMGVFIHLGSSVQNLRCTTMAYSDIVQLSNGHVIRADLVIPVIGSQPENTLLRKLPDVQFDPVGRALLDSWLRPSPSHPALFVIGDAGSTGDAMTIVGVVRQAPWLAKAIGKLLKGASMTSLAPYSPWPLAPIIVPLGPKRGASLLPLGLNGLVAGSFLTSAMKGKNLFLDKYQKFFSGR